MGSVKFVPAHTPALPLRQDQLGVAGMGTRSSSRSAESGAVSGEQLAGIDRDGEVLDILVTLRRDTRAAGRFLLKLLKGQGRPPSQLVDDKLRRYVAGRREPESSAIRRTGQHVNDGAEVPPQRTRKRERPIRRFESSVKVRPFLAVHSRPGIRFEWQATVLSRSPSAGFDGGPSSRRGGR